MAKSILPYFSDKNQSNVEAYYVAWFDLMGASNLMRRSLSCASILIGKLHDAIVRTRNESYAKLSLHPLIDGCYVLSKDVKTLLDFSTEVMALLFTSFKGEQDGNHPETAWQRQAAVRCVIVYGPVLTSEQMFNGFYKGRYDQNDPYFKNVFVGNLLGATHGSERKAPPFGIFIDSSAIYQREFLEKEEQQNTCLWSHFFRWFKRVPQDLRDKLQELPSSSQEIGERVLKFFEAEKLHRYESYYPVEKHEMYVQLIREYFEMDANHACNNAQ